MQLAHSHKKLTSNHAYMPGKILLFLVILIPRKAWTFII